MSERDRKILLGVKIVFIIIPCIIFLWLVNENYVLMGQIKYIYKPGKYLANRIVTLDQANLINGVFQSDGKIHWLAADDNLKFTAKILRNFDKVRVKLTLNNISQSLFYLYAQGGVDKGEYHDLVSSQLLNELTWPKIQSNGLILWQRPNVVASEDGTETETKRSVKQYQTVEEFQTGTPPADRIGVFGLATEQFYKLPDYQNDQAQRSIDHYFRGKHTLYFYKKNEPFQFSFQKIDLNRLSAKGELTLKIFLGSQLVYIKSISDDGDILGDSKVGQAQDVAISLPDLKKGYYRLEIGTSEDVIFGEIKTNMKNLVFNSQVFFADGPEYLPGSPSKEAILKTDSSALLSFVTPHDSATGQNIIYGRNLTANSKTINIKNKKEIYAIKNLKEINNLKIPNTDLMVMGGNFSFPDFQLLAGLTQSVPDVKVAKKIDDLDYIIAAYNLKEGQGLITFEKEYAFKDLFQKDKKIYFNIYSPGLYAGKAQLEIKQIEVTFSGQALTPAKLWEKARLFLNNIFKKS